MGKRRVAAIGIDAAEWSDALPLIEAGALPNLEKIVASAAHAEVRGEVPYRAESVWTEFLTGRPARDSRYWTTATFDPSSYELWLQGAYRGAPFYARPDLRTVAFDIPHSVIAPEARGIQVTGWGAHSPQYPTASSPPALVGTIDRRFGVHEAPLSDSVPGWHNRERQRTLAVALADGARRKADVCAWLLEQEPNWDLFCTVFSETHTAGHHYFHGIHPEHPLHGVDGDLSARYFRDVWVAVDDAVGALVAGLDDTTTLAVFAVHGMQQNPSDATGLVLVPELLHRLAFGTPFAAFPPWDPADPPLVLPAEVTAEDYLLRTLTEPRGSMYGGRTMKHRLAWEARRTLPDPVVRRLELLWRSATGDARRRWWDLVVREPASPSIDLAAATVRKPLDYHPAAWYCHRWPQMRAFVIPSFSDAHIRINLVGRERDGLVAPEEYERALDEVEVVLRATTDARSGAPIVDEVFRMRTDDPFADDGPTADLVVTFATVSDAIRHPGTGVIGATPLMRTGEHSVNGWLAIQHPGGSTGELGSVRPCDLGPTLVDLLGRSPSPLTTGRSFAAAVEQ